jgi:hypothetical protein
MSEKKENVKVESLVLDDGRKAERHISVDQNGNETIEIFAEEKRPLKLEKRVYREMKNIVSKEVHQTVKNGEVSYEEVLSLEPEVPLQVRSKIGVVEHAKVVDGDYVKKEEVGKMIEEGVVAGVLALLEHTTNENKFSKSLNAKEIVEKNVEDKKKKELFFNYFLGFVVFIQLLFFLGYMFLM